MLDYTFYRSKFLNKTLQWHQSDRHDQYRTDNVFGPNLYKPDSFSYSFNTNGFRCDEFSLASELPIVFLGCSFTEGEGLPVEATWAYRLLTYIRARTRKTIPYWNLSISGGSIDMNAASLANYIDVLKPTYIFYLRPPWTRRAVLVADQHLQHWIPSFKSPHQNAWSIPECFNETLTHEHFAIQQADRSLTIIDLLAEKYNTKVYHFPWQHGGSEDTIQPSIDRLKNFTALKTLWPMNADLARDSLHPGPKTHKLVASQLWENELRDLF
jgi:hypothetical protein